MQTSNGYTIVKIVPSHLFNRALFRQFVKMGIEVETAYGGDFKSRNFPIFEYVRDNHFAACMKGDEVVGVLLCSIGPATLDPSVKICYQDLIFAKSPRAFKLLMDEFIDFGKANANHLISMIGSETNLKPESMEKLGFSKLEVLYRLEV